MVRTIGRNRAIRCVTPSLTPSKNLKAFYSQYATGTLTMSRDAADGVSPMRTNILLGVPTSSHRPVWTTARTDA
jgi:hypothetical protein